ncbi:MAG: cyclic nucleotide-binding domain-containing protein, partial [Anaerolineae bacterium]|nr:cyclic nucleotide-binding domain-containing protein [Anaerolineae bacterium]
MAFLDQDEILNRLSQVKSLRQLNPAGLKQMAAVMEVRVYAEGETIYRLGQIANNLYIIESGEVAFRELDRLGRQRDVGQLGLSEVFGAQAILLGGIYDRTAIATQQTTLLVLDRPALTRILNDHPYISRPLLREAHVRRRWGRVTFPSQANDEFVLIYARPHWSVLLIKLAWPLLFMGVVIAFSTVLAVALASAVLGALVIGFSLLAVAIVLLVYSYWDWWFDTYIVTNQRVISMLRRPFIQEQLMEARIGKIQNTTISFPNLWARLFGWSNVRIATAGGPPIVLPRIANGPRVHAVINELVAENRQRAALQELQNREAYIEARLRGTPTTSASGGGAGASQATTRQPAPSPSLMRALGFFIPVLREVNGTIITYRKHWILLFQQTWFYMLLFFVVALILVVGPLLKVWAPFDPISVGLIMLAIVLFARLLWLYEDWRNDLYLLTDSAVVDIERLPLYLREEAKQAGLDAIQDVSYIIPHPLAEFLDYGNILIQTAGPLGKVTWDHISN